MLGGGLSRLPKDPPMICRAVVHIVDILWVWGIFGLLPLFAAVFATLFAAVFAWDKRFSGALIIKLSSKIPRPVGPEGWRTRGQQARKDLEGLLTELAGWMLDLEELHGISHARRSGRSADIYFVFVFFYCAELRSFRRGCKALRSRKDRV